MILRSMDELWSSLEPELTSPFAESEKNCIYHVALSVSVAADDATEVLVERPDSVLSVIRLKVLNFDSFDDESKPTLHF